MQILNTGLYRFALHSDLDSVYHQASIIYSDAPSETDFLDFKIRIVFDSLIRRYVKPQISFYSDQHSPFKPLPVSQASAVLEWGMNWCIAAHEFSNLLIHSAVLVKDGKAIIFPALPGSGKSTLTAHLGLKGWDTYSDEMAIIDIETDKVRPLYRPVCLKNNSIDLIKSWHPDAAFTNVCKDTQKGDVAHVKVMSWDRYERLQDTPIVAVVFPKYIANSQLNIYQLDQVQAFHTLSRNAFNYNILGARGFSAISRIIAKSRLFEINYSNLEDVDGFLSDEIAR